MRESPCNHPRKQHICARAINNENKHSPWLFCFAGTFGYADRRLYTHLIDEHGVIRLDLVCIIVTGRYQLIDSGDLNRRAARTGVWPDSG